MMEDLASSRYAETGWLRRYRVRAFGRADQRKLLELKKGITIEDVHYRGVDVERQQGECMADNFAERRQKS